MKKLDDGYYLVEVTCNKETASEMIQWLDSLGFELDRSESALGEEPKTLRECMQKCEENGGGAGFIFELHFTDEESAMLAKMKYGK